MDDVARQPFEPELILIPGGKFLMGSDPPPLVPLPPATQVGPLEFDRSNEFVGGKSRLGTFAFLLNRARKQTPGPLPISVIHHGVSFADQRLSELEQQTTRSEEEEQEYRHLFRVKDFLTDCARPWLERAIELAVNDDRLRPASSLHLDDRLSQFLIGLRNAVFTVGTPVFWGDSTSPSWISEWICLPHQWYVWARQDDSLRMTIKVSEEEAWSTHSKYRYDLGGIYKVISERHAFDLCALGFGWWCAPEASGLCCAGA
jgi:hypothetical protein